MSMQVCGFNNKAGLAVKGIVVMPDEGAERKDTAALYLPGLVLGSTAVHRLGVDIGQFLSAKGYPVFLFDQSRIGESEGELPAGSHADMVNRVMGGEFVSDTVEIIHFIKDTFSVNKLVLIGHCGGGLTSGYAANEADFISGVFFVSTPISGQEVIGHNEGAMREYETLYKKKIFSWAAWKKLLTGRSDYAILARMIRHRFIRKSLKPGEDIRINQRFFDCVMKARRDKPIFMLMGERDPGIDEFRIFCERYLDREKECAILKDASHGFVTQESMDLLFKEIDKFVGNIEKF